MLGGGSKEGLNSRKQNTRCSIVYSLCRGQTELHTPVALRSRNKTAVTSCKRSCCAGSCCKVPGSSSLRPGVRAEKLCQNHHSFYHHPLCSKHTDEYAQTKNSALNSYIRPPFGAPINMAVSSSCTYVSLSVPAASVSVSVWYRVSRFEYSSRGSRSVVKGARMSTNQYIQCVCLCRFHVHIWKSSCVRS